MFIDYMRHAECIKERSTAPDFCGPHYNRLVEQVDFIIAIIIIKKIINIIVVMIAMIMIIVMIIIMVIITMNDSGKRESPGLTERHVLYPLLL